MLNLDAVIWYYKKFPEMLSNTFQNLTFSCRGCFDLTGTGGINDNDNELKT